MLCIQGMVPGIPIKAVAVLAAEDVHAVDDSFRTMRLVDQPAMSVLLAGDFADTYHRKRIARVLFSDHLRVLAFFFGVGPLG